MGSCEYGVGQGVGRRWQVGRTASGRDGDHEDRPFSATSAGVSSVGRSHSSAFQMMWMSASSLGCFSGNVPIHVHVHAYVVMITWKTTCT